MRVCCVARVSFPLLFAALTGRSGHGLARMNRIRSPIRSASYAKGLATGEIQAHLVEIYGTEVSRETISKITDEIVADMAARQNRPLDAICPVLLIDAITVKVRGAQITPDTQNS